MPMGRLKGLPRLRAIVRRCLTSSRKMPLGISGGRGTFLATLADNREVTMDEILLPEYAEDVGTTDAYAITLDNVGTPYVTGMVYYFKANTANTGAATLNINSNGAKT